MSDFASITSPRFLTEIRLEEAPYVMEATPESTKFLWTNRKHLLRKLRDIGDLWSAGNMIRKLGDPRPGITGADRAIYLAALDTALESLSKRPGVPPGSPASTRGCAEL